MLVAVSCVVWPGGWGSPPAGELGPVCTTGAHQRTSGRVRRDRDKEDGQAAHEAGVRLALALIIVARNAHETEA